ncbi:MAG TPA: hypothetical protein GX505_08340 [Clostridiales bacterium]|nr:hypothetical protein [Clostridiales bacterium]
MKNRNVILLTLILLFIIFAYVSCNAANTQKNTQDQEPHDTAFKGSTFLIRMDDLKAINIAANYLKSLGETVSFQETYIEYHEAGKTAAKISLIGNKTIEYSGDYLEVRLYDSEDPVNHPCEHCTIIYITQDGKILGQNKIFSDSPILDGESE